MSTLYKRGQMWYVNLMLPDGTRRQQSTGTAKKKEAEAILEKLRKHVLEGKWEIKPQGQPTFQDLCSRYIEYAETNRGRNFFLSDIYQIRKHILPYFGAYPLKRITFEVVEGYKAKRAKEANKPRTVNKELQILSRTFSLAVKWRLCDTNPLREVERLKDPKRPPRFLSVDEIARLLKAAEPSHLHPVILAAIHTGMRKGELLRLQWKDVDFETGMITVWASKTDRYRTVPMTPLLAQTLRVMNNTKESDFVFTYGGKPTQDLKRGFGTLIKKAGIINCRFHDLRHTFCSHLAIAGVPLQKIKELAGHQNFQTTLLYAHLQPDHLRGEVIRLPFANGPED